MEDTGLGSLVVLMVIIGTYYIWDKWQQYRRKKRLEATPYGRYKLRRGL